MRKTFALIFVTILVSSSLAGLAAASWPEESDAPASALSLVTAHSSENRLSAFAPLGGSGQGLWRPGQVFDELSERLDLSAQQVDELQGLVANELPKIRRLVTDLVDARRGLFDAIHQHPADPAAIDLALAEVAQVERFLALERAQLVEGAYLVLTPGQQQAMDGFVDEAQGKVDRLIAFVREVVALRLGV